MKLFSILSLLAIAANTQAKKSNLRARRQNTEQTIYRITVAEDIILGERDATFEGAQNQFISIPIVNGVESGDFYEIELPQDILDNYSDLAESGRLYVTAAGASNDGHSMTLGEDSVVTVVEEPTEAHRQLQGVQTRRVAALRVSMGAGPVEDRQVGYTVQEIYDQMFVKDISLKKQFENCSNGAVKIEIGGVFEVTVPGAFTDWPAPAHVRNEALSIFAAQQGVNSGRDLFDHVVVILPKNESPGFVGNAGINHWVSTLNNLWGLDVMVYMHELGHNLGLNHAQLSGGGGDYSSYMSATGWKPNLEGPAKCFNAASNRQLGWYGDRSEEIDLLNDPAHLVDLAAFSEAFKQDKDDPILLEIGAYSVQYNLATEFNDGTEILRNEVTVAFPGTGGKTVVESEGLVPAGPIFEAADFEGTGQILRIAACEKIDGTGAAPTTMAVGVTLGQAGSPCDFDFEPETTTTTTQAPPPTTTTTTTMPATTTTTTTSATTTTSTTPATTTTTTTPTPVGRCPKTKRTRVTFVKNGTGKTKTMRCKFLGKKKKRARKFCDKRVISNHGNMFINPRVSDICMDECAKFSKKCKPRK